MGKYPGGFVGNSSIPAFNAANVEHVLKQAGTASTDERFARVVSGATAPKTRAMVPVLLCFDVVHDPGMTDAEFTERASELVRLNLGTIEEEKGRDIPWFYDEKGVRLNATIYPSDYDWCNTFENGRPDWECSEAGDKESTHE